MYWRAALARGKNLFYLFNRVSRTRVVYNIRGQKSWRILCRFLDALLLNPNQKASQNCTIRKKKCYRCIGDYNSNHLHLQGCFHLGISDQCQRSIYSGVGFTWHRRYLTCCPCIQPWSNTLTASRNWSAGCALKSESWQLWQLPSGLMISQLLLKVLSALRVSFNGHQAAPIVLSRSCVLGELSAGAACDFNDKWSNEEPLCVCSADHPSDVQSASLLLWDSPVLASLPFVPKVKSCSCTRWQSAERMGLDVVNIGMWRIWFRRSTLLLLAVGNPSLALGRALQTAWCSDQRG